MRLHRFQWPHDLKRASAAARFVGLQVRNPPWAWLSVTCDCCLLLGRTDHSSIVWCVWMNVTMTFRLWGGPGPLWSVCKRKKFEMAIYSTTNCYQFRFPFATDVSRKLLQLLYIFPAYYIPPNKVCISVRS